MLFYFKSSLYLAFNDFAFFKHSSTVRQGYYNEYLTCLFSWFGKMKFWYPWSVIHSFFCSWTVRETPPVRPSLKLLKSVTNMNFVFSRETTDIHPRKQKRFPTASKTSYVSQAWVLLRIHASRTQKVVFEYIGLNAQIHLPRSKETLLAG